MPIKASTPSRCDESVSAGAPGSFSTGIHDKIRLGATVKPERLVDQGLGNVREYPGGDLQQFFAARFCADPLEFHGHVRGNIVVEGSAAVL